MAETSREAARAGVATFAGGCFWCTEADFRKIPGVLKVISGYTGGRKEDPTYEEVCSGLTGHAEAVQVHFDPERVTYGQLLDCFWRHIDPTDGGGQFFDRGSQYRTAIFFHDEEQRRMAEESKKDLSRSGRFKKPIATEIAKFTGFYPAEDYHQDYSEKNPLHYQSYRYGSGRDRSLSSVWAGDPKAAKTGRNHQEED